ncbi:uncharacterized protein (DUF1778 family) [Neorhizobium sp. 2083]|uniref:type II toxin-antitoxin system TacA family antitoxin n=1 Tax=Neorhizobium sp. 2083 TaxID=2817762 RepID=UPI000DE19E1F|nr:DUF1778 domain-containing protein [Neorhizobium sp. 2083]MDR6818921.1 uncharacterized protein (DUF1778 family) [Neorhizobium sp. 2083]
MFVFEDVTSEIDEPNDARMNFRTKERIKKTIHRAAILSGVDDSAFVINAAYQSAMATIAAHEVTLLQPADHKAFFEALDNPPAPTQKLQEAFRRHGETVVSK